MHGLQSQPCTLSGTTSNTEPSIVCRVVPTSMVTTRAIAATLLLNSGTSVVDSSQACYCLQRSSSKDGYIFRHQHRRSGKVTSSPTSSAAERACCLGRRNELSKRNFRPPPTEGTRQFRPDLPNLLAELPQCFRTPSLPILWTMVLHWPTVSERRISHSTFGSVGPPLYLRLSGATILSSATAPHNLRSLLTFSGGDRFSQCRTK